MSNDAPQQPENTPATDPTNPLGLRTDIGAYYFPLDDGSFMPTIHAQGAWLAHEQHMAPVCGLIAHCLQSYNNRQDLQIARLTLEILGVMPAEPTTVTCETIRSGRTIELDEATLTIAGRIAVRARAWRLARVNTSAVAGDSMPRLPFPADLPEQTLTDVWAGGYLRSLEYRGSGEREPGRGQLWMRPKVHLVYGVPVHPVAAFLGIVDTANGVAPRVNPNEWMFPNTDLTIHLFREPHAGWVGFDTDVAFGDTGVGLTSTKLHDIHGPVGRAEQILTVRPMPKRR